MATLVHGLLGSTQKVYVEYSNEVWNGSFSQYNYAVAQGKALWPTRAGDSGGLVPGGACLGGGGGGFGSDGIGGMVIAGQFPVRADRAGTLLPGSPVRRVLGYGPEGGHGPGQRVVGGVLADPVFAGVHQRGDLSEVGAAFGVGDLGDLCGP